MVCLVLKQNQINMPKTPNIPELSNNLRANCCIKTVGLEVCPNDPTMVVLWDKISDACDGNNNKSCYSLAAIINLNIMENRPTGIVCHKCNNGGCVISLIIDSHKNTRFAKIN